MSKRCFWTPLWAYSQMKKKLELMKDSSRDTLSKVTSWSHIDKRQRWAFTTVTWCWPTTNLGTKCLIECILKPMVQIYYKNKALRHLYIRNRSLIKSLLVWTLPKSPAVIQIPWTLKILPPCSNHPKVMASQKPTRLMWICVSLCFIHLW